MRFWVARVGIGALLAAGLLASCGRTAEEVKTPKPDVQGEKVIFPTGTRPQGVSLETVRTGMDRTLRLPGRLIWDEDRTSRVFSPFAGQVRQILVQPGAKVAAGQALAELASPDFGAAQAEYRKAVADLELARQNAVRQRELHGHGVTSAKDLQQAEADFSRTQAEARRAQERVRLYGGGGEGVDQRFVLKSPIAGIVVEKSLNPGQEIRPDSSSGPLFVITDPTTLWLQLEASEGDLAGLKAGIPVQFSVPQYPGEAFQGQLTHVADYVDPSTRTVRIRGKVANPERRLKGEMYVTGEIRLKAEGRLFVPAKAVYLRGERTFVFAVRGEGAFERVEVKAGPEIQDWRPVEGGLTAADRVVVEGNLFLQQILQSQRQTAK